jgi:hypothetical protein
MKFKVVLWAFVVLLAAVPVFSQRTRTITNMDLEKYRQQRLRAEKEYVENYARLGFPSPEELQKQIEKARVERDELSARLAAERLQREQIEAEQAEAARMSQGDVYVVPDGGGRYFGWPYGGFFFNGRFPRTRQFSFPGRIGNGQPIVDYFGGQNTRPRFPAVRPRRH